jgi:hypothetical protein
VRLQRTIVEGAKLFIFGAGRTRATAVFRHAAPVTVFFRQRRSAHEPHGPSPPDPAQKKAVQRVKPPACGKVWVNPKSHFKNICEQAWKPAGVPSPKFVDMGQIDMRTKKPPERAMTKAAVPKSGISAKSRRGRREG